MTRQGDPSIRVGRRAPALLLAAGLIATILPKLLLRALHLPDGLWTIPAWISNHAGGDSWGAITLALQHLDSKGTTDFYQDLYYNADHQFIYSPLSLVFYRLTQFLPGIDWYSQDAMNHLSQWFIPAAGLVLALFIGITPPRLMGTPPARPARWAAIAVGAAISLLLYWPLISGFHNGQIQTWLSLLAMLSLLLWVCDARIAAGVVLGLACIVKPQLGIVALWALLRREWGLMFGCLAIVGLLGLASLAIYGLRIHLDYIALMGELSRRGESFVGNQSINGLLNRLWGLGPNLTFDGSHKQMVFDPRVYGLTLASSLAMLVVAIGWRTQATPLLRALDLGTLLLVSVMAAPVAYTHHYGGLLPVVWLAGLGLIASGERRAWPYGLLALAYMALSTDASFTDSLAATSWNPLQSITFFGGLLLFALLLWTRARLAAAPRRALAD